MESESELFQEFYIHSKAYSSTVVQLEKSHWNVSSWKLLEDSHFGVHIFLSFIISGTVLLSEHGYTTKKKDTQHKIPKIFCSIQLSHYWYFKNNSETVNIC